MLVQKFGGSILKDSKDVEIACDVILKGLGKMEVGSSGKNNLCVNVFSAFYGVTDALLKIVELAKAGLQEYEMQLESLKCFHEKICVDLGLATNMVTPFFAVAQEELATILKAQRAGVEAAALVLPKALDRILSVGEMLSSSLVYERLKMLRGEGVKYVDSREVIKTDSNFGSADVKIEKSSPLLKVTCFDAESGSGLDSGSGSGSSSSRLCLVVVMAGFVGSDDDGEVTTLGRNGSDRTVALVGSILRAPKIIIWKDVDGVFTADPKLVSSAKKIGQIMYAEMAELSYFGSKVIALQALYPAVGQNIKIEIKNIYNPDEAGTVISDRTDENMPIKGVSCIDGISLISVNGLKMVGVCGFSQRVFLSLKRAGANVVFIAQSSSEVSISIGIRAAEKIAALDKLELEFAAEIGSDEIHIQSKDGLSIIGVAGFGMANTPGVSGKIFSNLGKASINIVAIAQSLSEMNISLVVDARDCGAAVALIHNSIFENKRLNCLVAGRGVVGSGLLEMLDRRKEYFANKGLDINVLGVFDTKQYEDCVEGVRYAYRDLDEVIERFKLRGDINFALVDCTSSGHLVANYSKFIAAGFNVVTPNKKANTLDRAEFAELQRCFDLHKKHFFYEANVGAGLPVISTIKDLIDCGDKIVKIEGVFSGTLSYIFNNLREGVKFSDVVLDAKNKGFTEPDPKEDLCGEDVARKLLILARMVGRDINLADVEVENLADVPDDKMEKLVIDAQRDGCVLRYVGSLDEKGVRAKVVAVDMNNPLASTRHTDNIISITTTFYCNTPLVIRGSGAGREVTAMGVLSDLIKLSNLL